MANTYFAGIDPGLHGALAVISVTPGAPRPVLVEVSDLPTVVKRVGRTDRARYSILELAGLIGSAATVYWPAMVAIEDVQGRGNQMGGAQLSYGVGLLHMAAEMHRLPVTLIQPSAWKAALRCPASKPAAAKLAANLIDGVGNAFRGPLGGLRDGRAEAALLAYWAWQRFGRAAGA